MKKYKLLVFDMDGTILDTLEDLANSLNYVLKEAGYPKRTLEEVRGFVGNGIRKLIERAVPEQTTEEKISELHKKFMVYYSQHCADLTKPYDGICELLQKVRKMGYKTAVVSNKADMAVQKLCEQYFAGLFDAAAGEMEGIPKKPAPDLVWLVLDRLGCDKTEAVYIGDSDVDLQTAVNSGLPHILVEWGFRDKEYLMEQGAKCIVSKPEEIPDLI